MQIQLYKSKAENNRLDKANYLELFIEIEGELREQTSIVNPSMIIELKDTNKYVVDGNNIKVVDSYNKAIVLYNIDLTRMTNTTINDILFQCNYCYIPNFKRYYFIKDIISVGKYLWRINMSTDSLMSFKDGILNLSCFVGRNEYTYSPMIKDDIVSYYYDKEVTETTMKSGQRANITFSSYQDPNSLCITLSAINDSVFNYKGSIVEPPSNTGLPIVSSFNTGVTNGVNTYVINNETLSTLMPSLIDNDNASTYLLSIVVFPFELETTQEPTLIYLGKQMVLTIATKLKNEASQYYVLTEFMLKGDSFLDYSPYTRYEFYFPYHSQWVSIEGDLILNKQLMVIYIIDYKTGTGQILLYNDTDKVIVYSGDAQIGVKIPINSTNFTETNNTAVRNLTNGVLSGAIGATGIGLGLLGLSGSLPLTAPFAIGMLASGATSAVKGIANSALNANENYDRASGTILNSNTALYAPQNVIVRKTKLKPKGYDTNFFHLVGRPLNQIKTLKELRGFTKVHSCNVNIDNALDSEKEIIANALLNGVYLEDN